MIKDALFPKAPGEDAIVDDEEQESEEAEDQALKEMKEKYEIQAKTITDLKKANEELVAKT